MVGIQPLEGVVILKQPFTVRVSKDGVYAEITETDDGCHVKVNDAIMGTEFRILREEYGAACELFADRWAAVVWALQILAESRWFLESQHAN